MMSANDRGAAMILALLTTVLLAGIGLCLTMTGDTERRIAYNVRFDRETVFAAEAAVDRVIADLGSLPDWDPVLTGALRSSFADATRQPTLPSAAVVDLDALTATLQASTASFGADTPVWRLFAWGPLYRMVSEGTPDNSPYLVAWVADDTSEADNNPADDTNGAIALRVDAYGAGGARRTAEAYLARGDAQGTVKVIARRHL